MNFDTELPRDLPIPQDMSPTDGPRVLVVDDDPLMRAMTSAMLHSYGWQVFHAGSADEAMMLLKFCSQCQLELSAVIMDLVLPGGRSGLEALAALRTLAPKVPIIATSGFFESSSPARCLSFGFDDVLPKPYTSQQLCDTLNRHLSDRIPLP